MTTDGPGDTARSPDPSQVDPEEPDGEGPAEPLLLGLPEVLSRETGRRLHDQALALFEALYGASTTVDADLTATAMFFNPVAQGKRLRDLLAALPPLPPPGPFPKAWLLPVDDGRALLTPEGVAGMHTLRLSLDAGGDTLLLASVARPCASALLTRYGSWNQHRIRSVVSLLRGEDKPLQVQAAGVVVALLVNDSTAPAKAVRRFAQGNARARDDIDRAFFESVRAFTAKVAPDSKTRSGGAKLISGWPLGEAARRLGGALVVTKEKEDQPGLAYIAPGRSADAIHVLTRDLARGHRRRPTVEIFEAGYLDLVRAFRTQRGVLAGYGQLHEDPRNTEALRGQLVESYRQAAQAAAQSDVRAPEPA